MTVTDADLDRLRAAHRRDYDPYAVESMAERMAGIADRRAALPMSYSMRGNGCWVATEYDTIASVLRRSNRGFISFPIDPDGINQTGSENGMVPLELDGPRHRAFRTMLDPMFAPKKVATLEPELTQHANDLIDTFIETGTCDFNRDFALPFPGATVMAIMGWPMKDIEMMNRWTSIIHNGDSSGDAKLRAHQDTHGYMLDLIAGRRAAPPRDDLTAIAMTTEIEGAKLTDLELVELFGLMMSAGLGTVQSVMAQSMAYFARHQDGWARMFSSPDSVEPAIEELLRFTSPAMPTRTIVHDDVEVGGVLLPRGERVHMPLSAANRDPKYYPNPEEIDFDRPHKPHLAFGLGPHRCVGVHLARLELRIGFTELHRRIPGFTLQPGTEPKDLLGLAWGIEDVHLLFPPGPRARPADR